MQLAKYGKYGMGKKVLSLANRIVLIESAVAVEFVSVRLVCNSLLFLEVDWFFLVTSACRCKLDLSSARVNNLLATEPLLTAEDW